MYSIGQVLFVVLSKKNQVYPMQVVEVITKKSLKGEETQYLLQGGADKSSTMLLDKVDGEIFDTSEQVRKTLINRATQQINKLVDVAINKSKEWYLADSSSSIETSHPEVQSIEGLPDLAPKEQDNVERSVSNDAIEDTIMLPDGTLAKVKLNLPAI